MPTAISFCYANHTWQIQLTDSIYIGSIHVLHFTYILFCSNKTISIAEHTWASWTATSTGHW